MLQQSMDKFLTRELIKTGNKATYYLPLNFSGCTSPSIEGVRRL